MNISLKTASPYIQILIVIGTLIGSLVWLLSAMDVQTRTLDAKLTKIETNDLFHIGNSISKIDVTLSRIEERILGMDQRLSSVEVMLSNN